MLIPMHIYQKDIMRITQENGGNNNKTTINTYEGLLCLDTFPSALVLTYSIFRTTLEGGIISSTMLAITKLRQKEVYKMCSKLYN